MSPSPRKVRPDAAVEALLRDLGPRLRRGGSAADEPPAALPSGLPDLDALLHGGLPRGRLSEISGPLSSGRTSLALALLCRATRAGEVVAVVDGADALDPRSATSAGVALERVLWVRPPGLREALRSAERLLETRGFALVLLDLAAGAPRVTNAAWTRLARAATASRTALVVLSAERLAGTQAEVALALQPARARFSGTPLLLEALETEVALVRHRSRPCTRRATLRLQQAAEGSAQRAEAASEPKPSAQRAEGERSRILDPAPTANP